MPVLPDHTLCHFGNHVNLFQMLESHPSSKVALKIEDIYKKVAIGIQRNKSFSCKLILLFIHEVLMDTVKEVKPKTRYYTHH